jgi:hypothetical protein
MKKINLLKDKISVNSNNFLQAINQNEKFGITIDGQIHYEPFKEEIYIFQGKKKKPSSLLQATKPILIDEILGGKYKVLIAGDQTLVYAGGEWDKITKLNKKICDYEDGSSDGIEVFDDSKLEEIGWNGADFDISYRDLVEVIEPEGTVDGYLVCIENLEPYNFIGFAKITDIKKARKLIFEQAKKLISLKIQKHPHFTKELLDEDLLKTVSYFDIDLDSL